MGKFIDLGGHLWLGGGCPQLTAAFFTGVGVVLLMRFEGLEGGSANNDDDDDEIPLLGRGGFLLPCLVLFILLSLSLSLSLFQSYRFC